MKKSLLTLCAAALALSTQAETTTFMAQGAPKVLCPNADNSTLIQIPAGFVTGISTGKGGAYSPKNVQAKAIVSELVMIEEVPITKTGTSRDDCNHVFAGSYQWFWNRIIRITPAAGVTVTKIEIQENALNGGNYAYGIVTPREDKITGSAWNYGEYDIQELFKTAIDPVRTQVWEGSSDNAVCVANTCNDLLGQGTTTNHANFIAITTTGTPAQVALPACSVEEGVIAKSQKLELSCPTEGAKIYYTVTYGTETQLPTTESTLYTGPITLEQDAIVRAIAVKDGLANSFPIYKEYYVVPDFAETAVFNFNDYTSLKDSEGKTIPEYNAYPIVDTEVSTGTTQNCAITIENPICDKEIVYYNDPDATANTNVCLSNTFGGVVELRPLNNSIMVFSAPSDYYISAVYFEASIKEGFTINPQSEEAAKWEYKESLWNHSHQVWRTESKECYEIKINGKSSNYVDRATVVYSPVNASVSGIAVDNDAPVEYFNLQGIRVANPTNGIFIKRQGCKATKVIL